MRNVDSDFRNTVFMVMPFSDSVAEDAYKVCTKTVVETSGMKIVRADEIFSANPVFDDIVAAIEQAVLVIVDISGSNPNCFYELGIAHTIKRGRTIMITHDQYEEAPFDVSHFRIIQYENTLKGKQSYEETLQKTIASILNGVPELYADEFDFYLRILKGTQKEHSIWVLQAIALATRPLGVAEEVRVEGTSDPQYNLTGASHANSLDEFIKHFSDTGYVLVVGGTFALSNKGRAFAEYATAKGYKVFAFNGMVFEPGYKSIENLERTVAPEKNR